MAVHDATVSLSATATTNPVVYDMMFAGASAYAWSTAAVPSTYNVTYPSGVVADDLVLLVTGAKTYPQHAYPTTSNDWKFDAGGWSNSWTGGGDQADDDITDDRGISRVFKYHRVATSSLSGNISITNPDPGGGWNVYFTVSGAVTLRFKKPAWGTWDLLSTGTAAGYAGINTNAGTLDGLPFNTQVYQYPNNTRRTGVTLRAVDSDSDGMFIAVGDSGTFWRSTDNGANWASSTPPWSTTMYAIQWTNGMWVTTGASGAVWSSPDGENWTSRTTAAGFGSVVVYGLGVSTAGTFMACGGSGKIARSTDGINWTQITHSMGTNALYDVSYGERSGRWITVGTSTKWGYSTNDGVTWTQGVNSGTYGVGNDLSTIVECVDQDWYSPYNEYTAWIFGGLVNDQYAPYGLLAYCHEDAIETTGPSMYNSSPQGYGSMWGSVYTGTVSVIATSGYFQYSAYPGVLYGGSYEADQAGIPPTPANLTPDDFIGVAINKKDASMVVGVGRDLIVRAVNHNTPRHTPVPGNDIRAGDAILIAVTIPSDTDTHSYPRIRDHYNHLTYTDIEWLTSEGTSLGNDMTLRLGIAYAKEKSGVRKTTGRLTYYCNSSATLASSRCRISVSFTRLRVSGPEANMRAKASLTASATVLKTGLEVPNEGALYTASLIVDAFVQKSDIPVYVTNSSTTSFSETSGTDISLNYNYGQVDNLVVVTVTADNTNTTTPTITVSDAGGNTYTQVAFIGQNAASNAGVVGAMFYTVATTTTGNITATLSAAKTAKTMHARSFRGLDGSQRSAAVTAAGSSATPSVTSNTATVSDVAVGMVGVENDTQTTADTDTLNGSWVIQHNVNSGSGGNAATHQTQMVMHKIITALGAQTFNPASSPSSDWVSIIAIFAKKTRVDLGFYWRTQATLTASIDVVKSHDVTVTMNAVASDMTVTADVTLGDSPQAVLDASVATATNNMATANVSGAATANDFDAVADMTATAYVPQTHNTTVTTMTATVPDLTVNGGYGYDTTVSPMTATAVGPTLNPLGVINIPAPGTSNYNPTPFDPPDGYPDYEGYPTYEFPSSYGPTGEAGHIVELTDRHYQELVRSSTMWSHPNGPNGNYFGTYTMGARNSAVTPLGNDKFLVTWLQENWHQYYQDWSGYTPVYRELNNLPLRLVATVIDCANVDAPIVGNTASYDMPLGLRFFRTGAPQDAKADSSGNVCGIFSGFSIMPMSWTPDHGTWSSVYTDPVNIAFKVSVSGMTPSFSWVKTIGVVNTVTGFYNQIMYDGNDPVYCLIGYTGSVLLKLSGSSGGSLGNSASFGATSGWEGGAACMYSGSTGVMIGNITGNMMYITFNLSSLSIGSMSTFSPNLQLYGQIWKAKRSLDGYWYTALGDDTSPYLQVYKWDLEGGLSLVSKHISDVPHIKAPTLTLDSMKYGNYVRSYDMTEFWVSYGQYAPSALVSIYSKIGFCAGLQFPSLAMIATTIGVDQAPEHTAGPQVIGQIPATTSSEVPIKPRGWVSSPRELSSWQYYFPNGYLEFGEIDIAEISNGKIVVVVADTYGAADPSNGVFRIFTYIADPQNEPPPLKLSQRDDGKVAGAQRIAYDPQQESTIRAGWVAW